MVPPSTNAGQRSVYDSPIPIDITRYWRVPKAYGKLWQVVDGQIVADLHPGQAAVWNSEAQITLMLAGSQGGKALALDTPIPTPSGWTKMGELQVGDEVFDEYGNPTRITYVSPIYLGNACYRVTLDDDSSVIADADHQWATQTCKERKNEARRYLYGSGGRGAAHNRQPTSGVRTTADIGRTLIDHRGAANHALPRANGPRLPDREDLPIPPYTLGAWLGDGTSRAASITSADEEVLAGIRAEGITVGRPRGHNSGKAHVYSLGGGVGRVRNALGQWAGGDTLSAKLRSAGLLQNKHIPERYFFAGDWQRLQLLQGLMDTDGHIMPRGAGATCEYTTVRLRLAEDVASLARSLGIKVRIRTKIPTINGRPCRMAYRLVFSTTLPIFRIGRKIERVRDKVRPDMLRRYVVAVEPVPSVAVRCITVEAESGVYICSKAYIPTHNTVLGPLWLRREIGLRGPGDYMAVSPNFRLQRLKMEPEAIRLFDRTLHLGTWHKGDHYFEFDPARAARQFDNPAFLSEPTRILFSSAQNPESLESVTAKGVWLDEVGQRQFRVEAWEAIQRRVALNMGRQLLTTTPYAINWLKQQVYDKWAGGDPRFKVVQFASHVNPAFPREAMAAAKASLPRWRYMLFYLGRFTKPAGLIYSDYVDEYREHGGHIVHPFEIPARWPRYVGVDFGGANTALVWCAHDVDRDVFYLYRESLGGNRSTNEHAREFWENAAGENIVGVVGGSGSETQQRMDWNAAGVPVEEPAIGDVESGIDRVTELIKKKRLFVFDTLAKLRSELGSYSRKLDRFSGEPTDQIEDKSHFHELDAGRYLCIYLTEMLHGSGLGLTLAGAVRSGWHDVA